MRVVRWKIAEKLDDVVDAQLRALAPTPVACVLVHLLVVSSVDVTHRVEFCHELLVLSCHGVTISLNLLLETCDRRRCIASQLS